MKEKIDPELLEKYLNGAALSKEALLAVETILAKEEETANEIAKKLPTIPLSTILQKGIQEVGKKALKKKIDTINIGLTNKGFFIDETVIHEYLQGTLEGTELTIFENRLQQEEAFAESVAKEQTLLSGLKKAGKNQLKKKLAKVQAGLEEKGFFDTQAEKKPPPIPATKVASIFNRRNLAIAASLLILVIAYFSFPTASSINIDEAFANHFPYEDKISESIKDEISEIGYANNEKALQAQLLAALTAYNQQKYDEAIPLFNQVLSQQPDHLYAQLYLGQSQLNLKNWIKAIQILQPLGENKNFPLRAAALWGTSYSLLKQQKNKEAANILQQLSQFENPYQTMATALLTAL